MALVIIGLGGCKKSMNPVDYTNYFRQSKDLKVRKEAYNSVLDAEYKSPEYMALLEFTPETLHKDSFNNIFDDYRNYTHFMVKFYAEDLNSEFLKYKIQNDEQYYGRVQYFSAGIASDFKLVQGTDTIPCSIHLFERAYSIRPYEQIVLVFDKSIDRSKDVHLIYQGLFSPVPTKFEFSKETLQNIPNLKLS